MANIKGYNVVNSGEGATMALNYPSTQYSVHDFTEIPVGVNAPSTAGVLLLPFMSTKGIDRSIKYFDSNQLGDFIEHYGEANIKKFGLSSRAAVTWLTAGGRLAACRITMEDARYAGAHLELDVDQKAGGNVIIGTHTVTLPSKYDVLGKVIPTDDYDDLGDYEMGAKQINSVTNSHFPFLWVSSRGRGRYGNDMKVSLNLTPSGSISHPDFNRTVPTNKIDIIENNNFKENYEISLQSDVITSNLIAKSFESVIETNSVNRITAGRVEDIDDKLVIKFATVFDEICTAIEGSSSIMADIAADTDKTLPITIAYNAVSEIATALEDGTISVFSLLDLDDGKITYGDVDLSAFFEDVDFKDWESINLSGGQDNAPGEGMKSFDWDFNPTGAVVDTPMITGLFNDFFSGVTTNSIYDYSKVPCDIIVDMDYPTLIKQSILGLCQDASGKRGDITYLMNAPLCATESQLHTWEDAAGIFSKSVFAWCETSDTLDAASKRYLKGVPITYLALTPIAQWFLEGGKSPFAGERVCPGIITSTMKPPLDDIKEVYGTFRYNVIRTAETGNTFYGQTAKFKIEGDSVKLPNKIQVNRFKRMIHEVVERRRFTITSEVADIEKYIIREMALFRDIFTNVTIEARFAAGHEAEREAAGILDVICTIQQNSYVENFNIPINLMSSVG